MAETHTAPARAYADACPRRCPACVNAGQRRRPPATSACHRSPPSSSPPARRRPRRRPPSSAPRCRRSTTALARHCATARPPTAVPTAAPTARLPLVWPLPAHPPPSCRPCGHRWPAHHPCGRCSRPLFHTAGAVGPPSPTVGRAVHCRR
jgi:hypothetical protein